MRIVLLAAEVFTSVIVQSFSIFQHVSFADDLGRQPPASQDSRTGVLAPGDRAIVDSKLTAAAEYGNTFRDGWHRPCL